MVKLSKLFLIYSLFIRVVLADSYLENKVVEFKKVDEFYQKEKISGDIYFQAVSNMESGNSGKALKYLKVALEMTPEHQATIRKQINKALAIYIKSTLKIPSGNCRAIQERYNFIENISPDSSIGLLERFPKCLDENIKREKLAEKEIRLESAQQHLDLKSEKLDQKENELKRKSAQVDILHNRSKKARQDAELALMNYLKLELPEVTKGLDKQSYNDLSDEIEQIQFMNNYVPKEMIRTLQNEMLKTIKIKSNGLKIDYANVKDDKVNLYVDIKLSSYLTKNLMNTIVDKYQKLLSYKAGQVKVNMGDRSFKISEKAASYLSHNRLNLRVDNLMESRNHKIVPVIPENVILKVKLNYKDRSKVFYTNAILAGLFLGNSLKVEGIFGRKYNKKYPNRLFITFSSDMVKNLKDIDVTLDMETTNELNRALENGLVFGMQDITPVRQHLSGDKILQGFKHGNRKLGYFYITKDDVILEKYLYDDNYRVKVD